MYSFTHWHQEIVSNRSPSYASPTAQIEPLSWHTHPHSTASPSLRGCIRMLNKQIFRIRIIYTVTYPNWRVVWGAIYIFLLILDEKYTPQKLDMHQMASVDNTSANCAACGKEGGNLNTCNKCKMVQYCNAACKKKHRSKHKKACEKRLD